MFLWSSQLVSKAESKFILEKSALKASWVDAFSPNTVAELSCWDTVGLLNTPLKSGVKADLSGSSFLPKGSTLAELVNGLKSAHPVLSAVSDMGAEFQGLTGSFLSSPSPAGLLSKTSAHSVLKIQKPAVILFSLLTHMIHGEIQ